MLPNELLVFCPACKALEIVGFSGREMIRALIAGQDDLDDSDEYYDDEDLARIYELLTGAQT